MMWDLVAGFFIIAVIYMLVRPNSPGAAVVATFSDTLSNLIATAVGQSVTINHKDGTTSNFGYSGNFLPNPNA